MSWSINFIGKPENVANAIIAEADKMEGQSKIEFVDAMPHIVALVRQNFVKDGSGYTQQAIRIYASGHGSQRNGEQTDRHLSVNIEGNYGNLV